MVTGPHLLVTLLLGHGWGHEARLAGEDMPIQVQGGDVVTYRDTGTCTSG